ncbi:MAG: hypothetical protein CVU04_05680, partial [Bacteroidetes bacterium HGW-Bacteroidetes-20]
MLHKSYRKTALFFAWRYLFSKKKHNIINIISIISTIGIMVSTASLVIVLSVFNGLEDLVTNSFNQFNPDYVITPKQGKSFSIQDIDIEKIKDIPGVFAVEEIVSDLALITINNKQVLTHIKGVSNTYPQNLGLDTLIYDGTFSLVKNGEQFVVLGAINAGTLDINLNGFELLKFHYPKRDKKNLSNPIEAFNTLYLKPSGVFLSNTQYDDQIVFVPIQFAKDLTGFNDEITSLEVILTKSSSKFIEQKSIEKIVGSNFMVKNKYQQEELLFKTMKSEKLMVFLILSFVLIVAIFNIIGVIGMLIVEKKKDISILNTLGADRKLIHSIFIYEGILISFLGALLGMFIGFIVCFVQQYFGIIKLGDGSEGYII